MTSGDPTGGAAARGPAGGRARRATLKATPLGVMIMGLLSEKPMHPYEMQRVMLYRGKDEIVKVQRGSLYPAVERLVTAGLVEPAEVARDGKRPERTIYRLTEDGRETLAQWMATMLREPKNEFPDFPAALAFMPVLPPHDVRSELSGRMIRLRGQIAAMEQTLGDLRERFRMPRLFLIEDEFRLAMLKTELSWVEAVVADLASGELAWSDEEIAGWVADIESRVGPMPGLDLPG